MISLEKKEYGRFLMFNFPWMDHRKGIGIADVNLPD
jgi:hypothetical protein